MIKARNFLYLLLKRRIGNGESTRFWFDNWTPLGNLYTFLNVSTSRLGVPKSETIASLYNAWRWLLPPARSENQLAVQIHLTTVVLSDMEDYYEWEVDERLRQKYNTGEIYTYHKGHHPQVPWAKIVWFSYGIPRHSFLMWLVLLDRCPSRNMLNRWGLNVDPMYLLCNTSHESRNHLFFECPYSTTIWRQIATRCQLQPLFNWEDTVLPTSDAPQ